MAHESFFIRNGMDKRSSGRYSRNVFNKICMVFVGNVIACVLPRINNQR